MYDVQQSTTAYPLLFLMIDTADHITGKTGLSPTVTLSKAGAAFGSPAGAVSEIANGWYKVAGNATDTGTLGPLILHATSAGADVRDELYCVVAYNPQDSVRLGLTALPNAAAGANGGLPLGVDSSGRVDVLKVNGTSQTARDLGASVLLSSGTGTGQLDFTSGVVKANLAQILGTAITETSGQIAAAFKQFFDVASPTGTMKAITSVVTTTTATNLTNAPTVGDFTSTMKTSLNSATPAVTVSDKTGFSLSAAGVQAIWDALTSALTMVGSIGKRITDNLDVVLSTRLASSSYTAPDNTGIAAIESTLTGVTAKTDLLNFTNSYINAHVMEYESGQAPLKPTVAGRTLDVSTGGEAGVDWANVGSPTTTVGLSGTTVGTATALSVSERNSIADALLDRTDAIETGWTVRKVLRICSAALGGKLSGAATTTVTVRDVTDSKARVTATVDSDGNRTSVTLDGS